ncbi:MAG TPA: outer membrane beta-barrel protein [Myxococcaceae bacterium]|nr:outer membrane beta-barrel protein [Myxococcaceae bacterium]
MGSDGHRRRIRDLAILGTLLGLTTPGAARAQSTDDQRLEQLERRVKELEAQVQATRQPGTPDQASAPAEPPPVRSATNASVTFGGYVEAFYQWNFNQPSNFITNYRGFDNRHNIFTIENAVIEVQGKLGPVTTHIALQWGATPQSYYLSEPVWRATSGAGASGPDVWKYIQQANIAYLVPVGRGLTIDGGIFLSPIGPEGIQIKDQWNWSRSDLFFGLPFYHTGIRFTYPLTDTWTVSLQGYNGWNSVVDNNVELSFAVQATYTVPDQVTWNLLYFSGVERPDGAPEGRAWRNLFDTYLTLFPSSPVALSVQFDGGFEPNNFGTSAWAAGAASVRFHPWKRVYLSVRADYFYEWIAQNAVGTATPIFWAGSRWIASGTATVDFRPWDNISLRLEYRHDQAEKPLFFQGQVSTDSSGNFIPNAKFQNTLTLGAVAWF